MELVPTDFVILGVCLEGFFYGLYSAIFAMYLHYHASKNDTGDRTNNILFYALCVLYVLSVAIIVLDMAGPLTDVTARSVYNIEIISATIIGCCDFISQSILIYRCWIVWGHNIRIVVIPLILAITFLALWLSLNGSYTIVHGELSTSDWGYTINLTGLAISMTVNALVMGLIVLKIFSVFREVKPILDEQKLGATGGSKLRSIIFILIESGTALFSIQLARLVFTILTADAAYNALLLIAPIHEMLNGITPTIILVRVSMGLSFHDENSMVEATVSLCFAPDHPKSLDSVPETGSISIVCQDSRDDNIGVRQSNEIQMVDR